MVQSLSDNKTLWNTNLNKTYIKTTFWTCSNHLFLSHLVMLQPYAKISHDEALWESTKISHCVSIQTLKSVLHWRTFLAVITASSLFEFDVTSFILPDLGIFCNFSLQILLSGWTTIFRALGRVLIVPNFFLFKTYGGHCALVNRRIFCSLSQILRIIQHG